MAKLSNGYQAFAGYAKQIRPVISELIDDFEATLPEISTVASWALDQTRDYSLRPSKRIRGSLAAIAYDYAKGTQYAKPGLQLAAAIEIIQNYLLIIDDVIDQSSARRGQPTIHEAYKKAISPNVREADMVGILTGLLPEQIAHHIIASIDETPRKLLDVMRLLSRDMLITDLAQIDDIQQQFGTTVTREELLRKHEQKSSYYSFVNPLSCGLILGGKDELVARQDCESFGRPAGIAFQLRDDYLGVFGDSNNTGKPTLDDMREGKYTLMVHLAEANGTDDDRKRLGGLLGNPQASEVELAELQTILQRTHASEQAMGFARQYADEAIKAADAATSWDGEFAAMLKGLVEFTIERKG